MASGEKLVQLLSLLVVLVLLRHACSRVGVGALTINDLYPFGADNGDTVINGGDDISSGLIPLPYPVPVLGSPNGPSGAFTNLNGAVHFRGPTTDFYSSGHVFPAVGTAYSMVAAFWTDLIADCDGDRCTGMAYRVVGGGDSFLIDINNEIREAFPTEAAGFTAETALIVTWINVTACCDASAPFVHTFQAVIAFNARTVFVGLLYPGLTFGGPFVQAGFNLGDGVHSFRLPTSFSTAAFDKLSNVGQPGKWWFGLDQNSNATIGTFAYIDKPLDTDVCQLQRLYADTGSIDRCGNPRVMDWDFNNDGLFDNALDTTSPVISLATLRLTPGVHPIRARIRSPSSCPGTLLLINTTLTLTGLPPRIVSVRVDPETGNATPYVGEVVRISADADVISCNDFTTTINCGADSIAGEANGICQYSTTGVKTITITITQNGLSNSNTVSLTVVEYKQACSTEEYPQGGRAVGRRGCGTTQWTSPIYSRCNYPVGAGIEPSMPLWSAFASRAAEDAAVVRRFYGNRTVAETLRRQRNQVDVFGSEAAAALLNAMTLPYAQCPGAVKLKFRHALYRGVSSTEAQEVYNTFYRQNNFVNGCTLPRCV